MPLAEHILNAFRAHFHLMSEAYPLALLNIVLAAIGFACSFAVAKLLARSWFGISVWTVVLLLFVAIHLYWIELVSQPCIECYKESDDPNFGSGFLLVTFFSQPWVAVGGWLLGMCSLSARRNAVTLGP